MADFNAVPVVDVTTDNLEDVWPQLVSAIKSATFVALDNELTGLGERRDLFAKDVEQRYKGTCNVAKTRSIVSIGLSCFFCENETVNDLNSTSTLHSTSDESGSTPKQTTQLSFNVQAFNIFLMCTENYTVEPKSMKFLVEHGFDFNKQYAVGLPYYRGNDERSKKVGPESQRMRELFQLLLKCKVPLVLHNAMVDLIFLYHSFYASLPDSLPAFVADCSEMFEGGVYDTKYLTEFKARLSASFLEYVFRKCQRDNYTASENGWSHVNVAFPANPATDERNITWLPSSLQTSNKSSKHTSTKRESCSFYGAHGWCPQGSQCLKSHDIDMILDSEGESKKKRRKKSAKNHVPSAQTETQEAMEVAEEGQEVTEKLEARVRGHRAGFDAFMTGFIFAFYIARYGDPPQRGGLLLDEVGFQEYRNKIFLSGKDIPLQLTKSSFAKTSKEHRIKWETMIQKD